MLTLNRSEPVRSRPRVLGSGFWYETWALFRARSSSSSMRCLIFSSVSTGTSLVGELPLVPGVALGASPNGELAEDEEEA